MAVLVSRQAWTIASAVGLGSFLASVAVQRPLESAYDPLRQGISEFVHFGAAPVLVLGLLAWAFSLAVVAGLLAKGQRRWTRLQATALGIAVLGLVLAVVFATDRGAHVPAVVSEATTAGRLHDLGSALTSLGILAAIVIEAAKPPGGRRFFPLALLGAAIASSALLFALGDPLPGLRQRLLVAMACLWQAALLYRLRPAGLTSA